MGSKLTAGLRGNRTPGKTSAGGEGEMEPGRRLFFGAALPAAFVLLAGAAGLAGQGTPGTPSPRTREPESPPKIDPRTILQLNQRDIKRDVRRLFELAEELKKEVEKTDSTEVLSLTLVRKAGEIEKLAKHIRNLARG